MLEAHVSNIRLSRWYTQGICTHTIAYSNELLVPHISNIRSSSSYSVRTHVKSGYTGKCTQTIGRTYEAFQLSNVDGDENDDIDDDD